LSDLNLVLALPQPELEARRLAPLCCVPHDVAPFENDETADSVKAEEALPRLD